MGNVEKLAHITSHLDESDLGELIDFAEFLQLKRGRLRVLDEDARLWLEAGAHDAAKGIAAAEAGISDEELGDWLSEMEKAVKPL